MVTEELAPAFTLAQAQAAGIRKDQVYALLKAGAIERIGRGVFLQPDVIDPALSSLVAASVAQSDSTMCLTSALAYHGLTDAIPFGADIALPRGVRHPAGFAHVSWHSFERETFQLGREQHTPAEGITIHAYSAERTIVDFFRLMHQEGSDVSYAALRRFLQQRGNSPARLLKMAEAFPSGRARLRHALEVLV